MRVNTFKILIADRNPRVREFLKRELEDAGYAVQAAKDGRQVLNMITGGDRPELLILDLEMPDGNGISLLEEVLDRNPAMPVLIHTFLIEYAHHPTVARAAGLWEKSGNNIDGFKAKIEQVLQKSYPHRFSQGAGNREGG